MLRCLLLTVLAVALASCTSSKKPKSEAKIYEGDSTPGIKMYDEGPGSPLGR